MKKYDVAIIGAGAAGLSAGLYSARSGMKTVIFDKSAGGQTLEIDQLENYPGIFPAVNGSAYINTLLEQTKFFGAEIILKNATYIDKKNSFFIIQTPDETYESTALIYATGAEHTHLDIPGEKDLYGKGVSYCAVCDGPFFKGKNVTVIGGGDSACSEAIYLSGFVNHVDLIHRRNDFRAAKVLSERVLKNDKITVHFESVVKEIRGKNSVDSVLIENTSTGETKTLETSAVFIFAGMKPRTDLLENLKKDKNGYFITGENMETMIPGLYIAGDVRAKPLRQIVTAASDGAIAAFSAQEFVKDRDN